MLNEWVSDQNVTSHSTRDRVITETGLSRKAIALVHDNRAHKYAKKIKYRYTKKKQKLNPEQNDSS